MTTPRKPVNLPASYRPGVLASVNQRNRIGRMAATTLGALAQDMGGLSELSTQRAMLAERAAWLHLKLRMMEETFAEGGDLDAAQYAALTNTLCAVLGRLGLNRAARDVPSLREYMQGKQP